MKGCTFAMLQRQKWYIWLGHELYMEDKRQGRIKDKASCLWMMRSWWHCQQRRRGYGIRKASFCCIWKVARGYWKTSCDCLAILPYCQLCENVLLIGILLCASFRFKSWGHVFAVTKMKNCQAQHQSFHWIPIRNLSGPQMMGPQSLKTTTVTYSNLAQHLRA